MKKLIFSILCVILAVWLLFAYVLKLKSQDTIEISPYIHNKYTVYDKHVNWNEDKHKYIKITLTINGEKEVFEIPIDRLRELLTIPKMYIGKYLSDEGVWKEFEEYSTSRIKDYSTSKIINYFLIDGKRYPKSYVVFYGEVIND